MNSGKNVWIGSLCILAALAVFLSVWAIGANGMEMQAILAENSENSDSGTEISITMGGISKPLNLKVRAGDDKAYLAWSPPKYLNGSALIGFVIQRSIDGGPWDNLTMVDNKILKFTDTWISNGMKGSYRIVAAGESGWSDPSNEASATPIGKPWAPEAVTASIYKTNVILEWKAPLYVGGSEITKYSIFRKTDLDRTFMKIAVIQAGDSAWIDEGVSGNASVKYYVIAENAAGSSDPSSSAMVENVPSDNEELKSSDARSWIVIGGVALLGGVAIGASAIWILRVKPIRRASGPSIPMPYQANCGDGATIRPCS